MYRYYKGEERNPYVDGTPGNMFWFYESVFEDRYEKNDSSDWHSFFADYGLDEEYMKLLGENDYDRPSDKNGVFELWLKYLFREKLSESLRLQYYA